MGIYDRDYIRSDAQRGEILTGPGSMCRRIVIVTIGVYLTQFFGATPWLVLDEHLFQGQVWRLVTYAFVHSLHPVHIFFNMYFLWMLGQDLETIYGPREFLRFYLGAAVFAALVFVVLTLTTMGLHPERGQLFPTMAGASGAVMAVLVVMAMFYPTRQIIVFFILPLELRWAVLLYLALDLYPLLMELGAGGGIMTGVAHGAHLGGMLYGFLYKYYDWRWDRLTAGWSSMRRRVRAARSNVKLYRPPEEPANFDEQVDTILAKIHREGEASLTQAERDTLTRASRKYKDRKE